jgi:hypothetical protein
LIPASICNPSTGSTYSQNNPDRTDEGRTNQNLKRREARATKDVLRTGKTGKALRENNQDLPQRRQENLYVITAHAIVFHN